MSSPFRIVVELVDTYLASGDFWVLWQHVAGPGADDRALESLDEDERRRFDALYDIVYMGQPEPVTSSEHAVGLRGGAELRGLIEAWRADVRRVSGCA
jgi:hypothetical protein